ncbi:MAG: hypothetical protein LBT86_08980 [Deltaproteobacteria bacterium]|jgi:hypothetical protein|nr:hypothetical protein [Deltaproteobacteria bacterium]
MDQEDNLDYLSSEKISKAQAEIATLTALNKAQAAAIEAKEEESKAKEAAIKANIAKRKAKDAELVAKEAEFIFWRRKLRACVIRLYNKSFSIRKISGIMSLSEDEVTQCMEEGEVWEDIKIISG